MNMVDVTKIKFKHSCVNITLTCPAEIKHVIGFHDVVSIFFRTRAGKLGKINYSTRVDETGVVNLSVHPNGKIGSPLALGTFMMIRKIIDRDGKTVHSESYVMQ
jgi:hypothetical protein